MNAPIRRRIVVVEDDAKIAAVLRDYLEANGFDVELHADGRPVAAAVRADPPAAVVLDLMLPGLDGIEVCKALRQFTSVPIMMVTARVDEIDRLLGLELGADDYVCKPFSPREVVARIKALLRRAEWNAGPAGSAQGFAVDEDARRIRLAGRELPLTPLEYQLLRMLLRQPERVFTRDQLLIGAARRPARRQRSRDRQPRQEHPAQDRGGRAGHRLPEVGLRRRLPVRAAARRRGVSRAQSPPTADGAAATPARLVQIAIA